jgi:galactonate dehydratase
MKIIGVEVYLIPNPWKGWVFIRLLTNNGEEGIGEATHYFGQRAVKGMYRDVREFILGKDPLEVEKIWWQMFRETGNPSKDATKISLMSGIEVACWDIIGKHFGAPVYQFFGGIVRDKVKVYANGWYRGIKRLEDWGERAKEVVKRGYRAMKFDPFGAASGELKQEDFKKAIKIIEIVRSSVGNDVELMIEGHGRFNVATAIKIGKELEKFNVTWFEDPVMVRDIQGLIKVSRTVSIPIASGEWCISRFDSDLISLLTSKAVDILLPDVISMGGLSETKKVSAFAEVYGTLVALHQAEGPINTMSELQLDATLTNFRIQEYFGDFAYPDWAWELLTYKPEFDEGFLKVPKSPGIGTNLNMKKIEEYMDEEKIANFNLYKEGWEDRGFSKS